MTLDTMSGPPLPSRSKSSIKGRPLPSAPSDAPKFESTNRNRALPSLPVEPHTTAKPPSSPRGPRYVKTPIRKPESEVNQQGSRPLPPPPDLSFDSPSAQNDSKNLRRGLPPVPNGSTTPTSTNNGTLKRPLPPPPTESSPSVPPSRSGSSGGTLQRRQSNNSHTAPPQLPHRQGSPHNNQSTCGEDFERRFRFHGARDFPPPDEFHDTEKRYPSIYMCKKPSSGRHKKTQS